MDDANAARLRYVYDGLTIEQRHHLKVIVEDKAEVLSVTLCKTLVVLSLVRQVGGTFVATEDGCHVAGLY